MAEVKLFGTWMSPFVHRVIWALKIKEIPYEYIEEDLSNKSSLLLKYNPVHKKVPVLLHGDKVTCESAVIVEYIDETWPQNPLLPIDPYERAQARFWVKYYDDKIKSFDTFRTTGEEHENAMKASFEMLKTLEEKALGDKKFFGGDTLGIVDLACAPMAHWSAIAAQITGARSLDPNKLPRLHAWTVNIMQQPVIKENLPDPDRLLVFLKHIRENMLGSA